MRTIAIANQKGGCGKTTTSVNLATAMAMRGMNVLAIDLDPQAHTTLALGQAPENLENTIFHAMVRDVPAPMAITRTCVRGVDIIGSNILLSGAETELGDIPNREYVLSSMLATVEHRYDICVIDCSPSLSVLTLNALVAAQELIIPVQTHYYAVEGLRQLLETIDVVKERFNPQLRILGMLLTFVDRRTLLSKDVQKQLREHFDDLVFDTVIHSSVRLAEAPSAGQPILSFDQNSTGAREYMALAEEVTNGKTTARIA